MPLARPARIPVASTRQSQIRAALSAILGAQHNIVLEHKPALTISVRESLSILPFRLALTGALVALPGAVADGRDVAPRVIAEFHP